jgi:hypothetical protein
MPPRRLAIFAVLALCWCAGCDTIHGVSRSIPISALPAPDAVEQALRATPGVTEVTRRDVPASKSWSLYKGTMQESGYAQFSCRDTTSAFAAVEPKETDEAGKQLRVYCIWMNHVPTNDELSNARGLIDRLCSSLHERVPTVPASSSSDDKFIGIKGH